MKLHDVMTIKEAAERWGIGYETLRQALKRGKLDQQIKEGNIRKSKGVWLFTAAAMTEIFGDPNPGA